MGDLREPLNHAITSPAGPHVWLNSHMNLYSASTPAPPPPPPLCTCASPVPLQVVPAAYFSSPQWPSKLTLLQINKIHIDNYIINNWRIVFSFSTQLVWWNCPMVVQCSASITNGGSTLYQDGKQHLEERNMFLWTMSTWKPQYWCNIGPLLSTLAQLRCLFHLVIITRLLSYLHNHVGSIPCTIAYTPSTHHPYMRGV